MINLSRKLRLTLLAVSLCLTSANAQKFSAIVDFGDSLSDLGNTAYLLGNFGLAGLADYSTFYYDQGRWSNGPVWIEDIALKFGFAALQRNYYNNLYGTDFAWGGSTSFTGSTFGLLPNLQTQIGYYITLLSTQYARMPQPADTLYTVWSGGNDVIDYVVYGPLLFPVTPQQVADNIATAVTTLYQVGGRIFLVPNLPPLGDKPNFRNTQYQQPANNFVVAYNPLLHAKMSALKQTLPGITIIEFDTYTLFQDAINHPQKYNLINVTDAAFNYANGTIAPGVDQYLFWDGTHPTRTVHALLGDKASKLIRSTLNLPSEQPQP